MDPLWLLEGTYDAPGWAPLEKASRADEIEVILFDRDRWALMRAAEAPTKYEGLVPRRPPDGLYINTQGFPIYLVDGEIVDDPVEVIVALGEEAEKLLDELDDPDTVLQRLGRAF